MKKTPLIFVLLLACLLGTGISAFAQSSPNFTQGQVPTPAQWNGYFALKQDYLGAAPLLITGGTLIGKLNTNASTTVIAGFNIAPGTALTSPVNGDIWTTAAGFFVQINGGTVGPLGTGGGGGGSGFTIGGTLVGGTPNGLIYDNAGVVGNLP